MEHQDNEVSETVLEYSGMPLYSEIVRYEKTLSETSTFPSGQKTKSATSKKQGNHIAEQDELENAAAALDAPVKTVKTPAVGPYKSEVTRAHGLWGPRFPYTATKEVCQDCKSRNGVHHPSCYMSTCTECWYFGHKHSECKHHPRTDLKKGGDAKRS